jgi:hypothetical protein
VGCVYTARYLYLASAGRRVERITHCKIIAPAANVATSSANRGKSSAPGNTLECVWYIFGVICAFFHRFLPVHEGEVGERSDRDDPAYRTGSSPEKEASSKAVSEIAFTGVLGGARAALNLPSSSLGGSDSESSSEAVQVGALA